MHFSKKLVGTIFELLTEQEMDKVAERYAKYIFKEQMEMFRREYAFSAIMEYFRGWSEVLGFSYKHDVPDDYGETYTIRFDTGTNWSLYYGKEGLIVEDLGIRNAEIRAIGDTVSITIRNNPQNKGKG